MSQTFNHIPAQRKAAYQRKYRFNLHKPTVPCTSGDGVSSDTDVLELARDITKAVKLGHHIPNWETMPPSLVKKISMITDNLCPPLADAHLQSGYKELGLEFGDRIASLTRTHLRANDALVRERLEKHDPVQLKPAVDIARKMLCERYGKRLPNHISKTLLEVQLLVGRSRAPVSTASHTVSSPSHNLIHTPRSSHASTPLTTMPPHPLNLAPALQTVPTTSNSTPPRLICNPATVAFTSPSLPLTPTGSFPPLTSDDDRDPPLLLPAVTLANRFLPLQDLPRDLPPKSTPKRQRSPTAVSSPSSDSQPAHKTQKQGPSIEESVLESNSSPLVRPKRNTPSVKPNPATKLSKRNETLASKPPSPGLTNSGVLDGATASTSSGTGPIALGSGKFIILNSKDTPIKIFPNIDVLLIGDSNLRPFTQAPPSWQIVCIPGLSLTQLTYLFYSLDKTIPLKHIIISAGINDRASSTASVVKDCINAAKRPGTTVHFQCINFSKNLDPLEVRNLQRLNRTAEDCAGVNLIPQIPYPTFRDFPPIHHSDSTAFKILDDTLSHISSLNC